MEQENSNIEEKAVKPDPKLGEKRKKKKAGSANYTAPAIVLTLLLGLFAWLATALYSVGTLTEEDNLMHFVQNVEWLDIEMKTITEGSNRYETFGESVYSYVSDYVAKDDFEELVQKDFFHEYIVKLVNRYIDAIKEKNYKSGYLKFEDISDFFEKNDKKIDKIFGDGFAERYSYFLSNYSERYANSIADAEEMLCLKTYQKDWGMVLNLASFLLNNYLAYAFMGLSGLLLILLIVVKKSRSFGYIGGAAVLAGGLLLATRIVVPNVAGNPEETLQLGVEISAVFLKSFLDMSLWITIVLFAVALLTIVARVLIGKFITNSKEETSQMNMTQEQQEKAYQFGCKLLQTAKRKKDYENLELLFSNLPEYKDAGQLEEQCTVKIRKLKRKFTFVVVLAVLICSAGVAVAVGAMYLTSPTSKYAFEENDDDEIIITGLKDNLLKKDGTSVSIPEEINECSVVAIEALASETVEEMILPETLESISPEAFADCPKLTTIRFSGTASQWMEIGGDAFVEKYSVEHEGDHEWQDWVLQEGYLCHEGGSQVRTCAVCLEQETEDAETREHSLVEIPAVEATCTATGLTTGWQCEFCGFDVTPQEETAMKPHTTKVVRGTEATCTKTGLTDGKKCAVCGEIILKQEVIEMKPHTETEVARKEPTCSEVGLTAGVQCSVCGFFIEKQNEIEMLEHTPVKVEAKAATCTEEGHSEGMKCSVCDTILTAESVIEKLPHTEVVIPAEEATCIKTGLTEGKKCSVCGEILEEQMVTGMTEHKAKTVPAVEATCTKTGLTEGKKCSVCGEILEKQKETAMVAHKEVVVKGKAATCAATGLTDGKKCSVCGKTITSQKTIAKTGHTYSEWKTSKSPTCTAYGEKSRSCTVCKLTETEQLSMTEHVYVDGYCKMCSCPKPSDGLVFKKNGDAYTVTSIGICEDYRVVIPDRHSGYPVTAIASGAFKNATEMMEIIIPSSVTTIGDSAFYGCTYLIDVELSEGLTTIGASAFAYCDSLTEIAIPDSVTKIGNYCFDRCYSLSDIYLGSGITTSAKDAFRYCEGVQQVTMDKLAHYAVIGSSISAYSPDVIFVVGDEELSECVIRNDKEQAQGLYKNSTAIYDVVFKSGVTQIARELFYGSAVCEITIPRTVQAIGDYAFDESEISVAYYEGTAAQWKRITKGRNCFPSGTTISCTDEDIDY